MKKLFLLVILIFSISQAQECKSLLESTIPDTKKAEFKTVEMTMTSEIFIKGRTMNMEVFEVIDRENKRLYLRQTFDDMTTIMILQNGDLSMTTEMPDGSTMPMPEMPALKNQLASFLDNIFSQTGLPQNLEIISCDGPINIDNIVSGEQIRVISKLPKFNQETEELQWQEQEMTVIVNEDDDSFGMLMSTPETGEILTTMKFAISEDGFTKSIVSTTYTLTDGKYQQSGKSEMAFQNRDKPIDESLFEVDKD